jgi:hypothetical protein
MDAKIEDAICRVLQRLDRYAPEATAFDADAVPLKRWGVPWSKIEDKELKRLWGKKAAAVIAVSLGRSHGSVTARAARIGLPVVKETSHAA